MVAQPVSQPRAAVYCRVSTDKQEDGYSLDEQEAGCRRYAEEQGYAVVGIYREVSDGEEVNRPLLDELRAAGRRGEADTLIVYVQDRLGRGPDTVAVIFYLLDAAGITPECVLEPYETGAMGAGMRAIRGMVSGMEKEAIRRRTQGGRRARAGSGKLIPGPRPLYGYRWKDGVGADGDQRGQTKVAYEIDEETAPVVRRIFAELAAGRSLRKVAEGLNNDGVPTPNGARCWLPSSVRLISMNQRYTGQAVSYGPVKRVKVRASPGTARVYRRVPRPAEEQFTLPEGTIPPLCTPEQWSAVREHASRNKQEATRRNRNPEAFLLRGGFVRCATCGRAAHTTWKKPGKLGRTERPVYMIYRRAGEHDECPNTNISAEKLDRWVWDYLADRLQKRENLERAVAAQRRTDPTGTELADVEHALSGVVKRQANLSRAIARLDDEDAAGPLVAELAALGKQKRRLEEERTATLARREAWRSAEQVLDNLERWRERAAEELRTMGYDEKRDFLRKLAVSVKLHPADHTPRYEVRARILLEPFDATVNSTTR